MILLQNLPLLMVAVFLVLTLAVGLYYSSKTTTLREYAVGNKQFTTATLVATVLATRFGGGGLVRTTQEIHSQGLYWIVIFLLSALNIWIISPLTLRMGSFMQHLSMPESIGSVYGKYPRIITALSCICSAIACIAGQIKVMATAISHCISDTNTHSSIIMITILSTFILVFYSTFGGIRAVIFTDVLQFITFTIIIPLLVFFIFHTLNKSNLTCFSLLLHQEKFQLKSICHIQIVLAIFAFFSSNLMSNIQPTTIQRVYMSSNTTQARKVFLYASLFGFVIMCCISLIGLFVFAAAPDLPKTKVWSYTIDHMPVPFIGLVSISLLAMAMSTADSYLNSCAVMVNHDLVWIQKITKENPYRIWYVRLTSFIVGIFAMILTFCSNDLLKLFELTMNVTVPILTAPFLLAIYGFRSSSSTAITGMTVGILSILAWNTWVKPKTGMDGSFFCMLANGLAMLAAHYLLPQPERKWLGST